MLLGRRPWARLLAVIMGVFVHLGDNDCNWQGSTWILESCSNGSNCCADRFDWRVGNDQKDEMGG